MSYWLFRDEKRENAYLLLKFLVGIVDTKLFEAVLLEVLETVDIL